MLTVRKKVFELYQRLPYILTMFWKTDKIPLITQRELVHKLEQGETVTILDVRSEKDFEAARIQGAINIPFKKINQLQAEVKPEEHLVFY